MLYQSIRHDQGTNLEQNYKIKYWISMFNPMVKVIVGGTTYLNEDINPMVTIAGS